LSTLTTRLAQKAKQVIKNLLRFLLRYKRLLRFGGWLLKKDPRTRARFLELAGLTTPYIPQKSIGILKNSEIAKLLPETARTIYESLLELYAAKTQQTTKSK
jgi:hypothetical protein